MLDSKKGEKKKNKLSTQEFTVHLPYKSFNIWNENSHVKAQGSEEFIFFFTIPQKNADADQIYM